MDDRNALFDQLKGFSQRKLKKVETKVVTASGENLVEKRGAKGLQVLTGGDVGADKQTEPARKLDLQVGFIAPGFLIGSQDVAHDKKSLDSYGVTHILNLDDQVENKFEDDYNYKNINIRDSPDFDLNKVMEDCFDYIDDGRHYGNVLVHCSGTIGLSRSTTICIAYLMNKEKQKLDEAFNNVKEARSFVKPNEGFMKQLKEYEVKLLGAKAAKDSGIDDPFALRKKQEIEQEKAMVAGATSVKNRMKMFGSNLEAGGDSFRSKSVSPSPAKTPTPQPSPTPKWSERNKEASSKAEPISKSMTPEPRKSWQSTNQDNKPSAKSTIGGPPPPPPPMPSALNDRSSSTKLVSHDSIKSSDIRSSATSPPAPPPPPPPPAANFMPPKKPDSNRSSYRDQTTEKPAALAISSSRGDSDSKVDNGNQRMVFGRVRPPPMKISGGMSIERQDSVQSRERERTQLNHNGSSSAYISDSPSGGFRFDQRSASPLLLFNNNQPPDMHSKSTNLPVSNVDNDSLTMSSSQPPTSRTKEPTRIDRRKLEDFEDPMSKYQAPTRTLSLGQRRQAPVAKPPLGESLRRNPWLQQGGFDKVEQELQSSLFELNNLIEAPATPKISYNKPPRFITGNPLTPPTTSSAATTTTTTTTVVKTTTKMTKNSHPDLPGVDQEPSISYRRRRRRSSLSLGAQQQQEQHQPQKSDEFDNTENELVDCRFSSSVCDLRSVFEQPAQPMYPPSSPAISSQRPPLSASINYLRNSPWQSEFVQRSNNSVSTTVKEQQLPPPQPRYPESDFTIRRTASTSSRSSATPAPYRSGFRRY